MSSEFFSDGLSNPNNELVRKALADDIRIALWPHVVLVRQQLANWLVSHQSPVDLLPLPARPLALAEKCAALAAFHDSLAEGEPFWQSQSPTVRIDDSDSESEYLSTQIAESPWNVLVGIAYKYCPRANDPLRTMLAEIGPVLAAGSAHNTKTQTLRDNSGVENSIAVTVALSELARLGGKFQSISNSQNLAIGLFKWKQQFTGRTDDGPLGLSLADATAAIGGEVNSIVYWGADTWRQAEPLIGEEGNEIKNVAIDKDGKPILIDGAPIWIPALGPIEYRGVVVVDHNFQVDEPQLLDEMRTGGSQWVDSELIQYMRTAGLVLGKLSGTIDALWGDDDLVVDPTKGSGPIIQWISALYELQRRGVFTGEFLTEFWHWRVDGPNLTTAIKPNTDCAGYDTMRYRAIVREPIAASLQLIDWIASLQTETMRKPTESKAVRPDDLGRFKALLVDDIFSQALSIANKLTKADNYSPETFGTFRDELFRLKDGLNRAGEHLDEFPNVIRAAVEKLAAIINEAWPGPAYADVCRVLAESDLEACAHRGWREFSRVTNERPIHWSRLAVKEHDESRDERLEAPHLTANKPRDNPALKSLMRVGARFTKGADNHRTLSALLVHHAQLYFPKPPQWPDSFETQGSFRLNIRGGPRCDPRQLFDEDGRPEIGVKPLTDKDGNPVVFSDGCPIAMTPGASRTYSLYGNQFPGSSESHYSAACTEYMDAAAEAGKIIDDLPHPVKQLIWREWPYGFTKPEPCDLWTNAVFELAWQDHEGSGLSADRWTWWENKKLKIDDLARTQQTPLAGLFAELIERAGDPPRYWYSWLPNIWRASVAAIDILESQLDESTVHTSGVRPDFASRSANGKAAGRSTIPVERSVDSARSIEQLASDTPMLDKENPDQWLKFNGLKPKGDNASPKSLREQRSKGKKTSDGQFGVCVAGRIWRKDGRDVWYYVPSLLPGRDRSAPLIAAALRLISTVD